MVVISIKETKNENFREYKFDEKVAEINIVFDKKFSREVNQKNLERIGETGREIVEGLLKIKGITEIETFPEEIHILKETNYSWIEIEDELFPIFRKTFGNARRSFLTWISNIKNICV